jgi:hypothetical protein
MLRKLQRSLTLLAEMRVAGCVPDQYSYTSALNACTTAGDATAAVALLRDLVARAAEHGSSSSQGGPAPDGYAYGSAMNACSKVRTTTTTAAAAVAAVLSTRASIHLINAYLTELVLTPALLQHANTFQAQRVLWLFSTQFFYF